MKMTFRNLNRADWNIFRGNVAFLNGRLEELSTVEWALKLSPVDTLPRLAIVELLNNIRSPINEPWLSTWRLIEQMWNDPPPAAQDTSDIYVVIERLKHGERNKALSTAIVDLVRPRIKVETNDTRKLLGKKVPRRPKTLDDLVATELVSGHPSDARALGLENLNDLSFLSIVARDLNAAVDHGLDLARQTGWTGERQFWKLGGLHRVYYVLDAGGGDPDRFHEGIAPSVKMLYAVVSRLSSIDKEAALEFVHQWKMRSTPVHLRLWAAMARNPQLVSGRDVGEALLGVDDIAFWDTNDFPEIAELRAERFKDLALDDQTSIVIRLRQLPPRKLWFRDDGGERIKKSQLYLACRELRRIEDAGGELPKVAKRWLEKNVQEFTDLKATVESDSGFLEAPQAHWVAPSPDRRYDALSGYDRLTELESALSVKRSGPYQDMPGGAADWITDASNADKLLTDIEAVEVSNISIPRVWDTFASIMASRDNQQSDSAQAAPQELRVLTALIRQSESTLQSAMDGTSQWMLAKRHVMKVRPEIPKLWLRLWPYAVSNTNGRADTLDGEPVNKFVQSSSETLKDLDTLNTPAGRLAHVFVWRCPNLNAIEKPFETEADLIAMREAITATPGYAAIVSKYVLMQNLPYYYRADKKWTHDYLVSPLLADGEESLALWRALAHTWMSREITNILGPQMVTHALDLRLERDARKSLVFRVVVECMFAIYDNRERPLPEGTIQQMIRALDDEVRAHVVNSIKIFIKDAPKAYSQEGKEVTSEQILVGAVTPFLQRVWPQESSLVTPGISEEFADLPIMVIDMFAEAVSLIERFLVPFKSWSMHAYGFFPGDQTKLDLIDNSEKAKALLHLLDLTIGTAEDAIIPLDLAVALQRIKEIAPSLVDTYAFRRLSAMTRRA